MYDADMIRTEVSERAKELFAPYAEGRPSNWSCDARTRDLICIMAWLRAELTRMGYESAVRICQEGEFYRVSRSDMDLYESAAKVMNDTAAGKYDLNRKPHRRWG